MRITILGCGSSSGTPSVGRGWGAIDPANPRNRRLRASILLEWGETRVLVDTSPDLREQLLAAGVDRIDAVVYTHEHADHTHGIDDLRWLNRDEGPRPIPVYGSPKSVAGLCERFRYIFEQTEPQGGYPPFLVAHEIHRPFEINRMPVESFATDHGRVTTLGLRFGPVAYAPDVAELDEAAFAAIAGVHLWIVDCFGYRPHATHVHFEKVLRWIERVRPERAVLTHMSVALDYDELRARCPPGVEPGYDGMVIEVSE